MMVRKRQEKQDENVCKMPLPFTATRNSIHLSICVYAILKTKVPSAFKKCGSIPDTGNENWGRKKVDNTIIQQPGTEEAKMLYYSVFLSAECIASTKREFTLLGVGER
ncbi:hypothetical protein SLA2020_153860 [Shorea laevis]